MPIDPQALETANDACRRLRGVLGENLNAFVLYGSAVRGTMVPGRSDINVMIVLNASTPEAHRAIADQLRGEKKIDPFILSRAELPRSRRVFALKFKSIGRNYKVLHGEDPLADFDPSCSLLLFLSEQSLRNLRLRLTHAYVLNPNAPQRYVQYLLDAYPNLVSSISEIVRCAGIEVPPSASRARALAQALGVDTSVLHTLRDLRHNPRSLSTDELHDLHAKLYQLLSDALDWTDRQWPNATEIQ